MELRDYWHVVQRRWRIIAAVFVLCTVAAGAITALMTPQYSSTARMFVSTSEQDSASAYQGGLFATQRVASYSDLVENRDLAETVGEDLGLSDVEVDRLGDQVEASVTPETVNLAITATHPSPREAQIIAQTYAEELQVLIEELETPPSGKAPPIKASIVDSAPLPGAPVSPQPVRNLLLGGVLGSMLGLGIAVLRELLDTTIKSPEDAVAATASSVLGTFPFDSGAAKNPLVTGLDSHAPRVEAFRVLRTNMQFVGVDANGAGRVYVVSSSLPSEGKTTTAVNLALTLAQSGQRVVLVEADLRRPRVGATLGTDSAIGLTTVLVGKLTLADALQDHESGLSVLGSGATPPNPAELLQSHAMSEVLYDLRQKFEIVIIDAPPLLPVTDAALLGSASDGVLLVVRHGSTTRDQLGVAAERLAAVGARTIGVVLNMVPNRRLQGYGYGYGYGYAPDQELPAEKAPGRRRRVRRRTTSH